MAIVNKSFVVTREGRRLFGMDAELYTKMQAKEDPNYEKKVGFALLRCLAWLRVLFSHVFEGGAVAGGAPKGEAAQ